GHRRCRALRGRERPGPPHPHDAQEHEHRRFQPLCAGPAARRTAGPDAARPDGRHHRRAAFAAQEDRRMSTAAPTSIELMQTALSAVLAGGKLAETAASTASVAQKESLRDIVTAADQRISELLIDSLKITGLPVISEEAEAPAQLPERCWVVDPIDGTV